MSERTLAEIADRDDVLFVPVSRAALESFRKWSEPVQFLIRPEPSDRRLGSLILRRAESSPNPGREHRPKPKKS